MAKTLNTEGGLEKRSLTINGHRTSIALEPQFWAVLERLALLGKTSVPKLIASVDRSRATAHATRSLASAIRVHCLLNAAALNAPTGKGP
jgi:predicted DNA-binding ribbon-helix-helix protein